MTLIDRHSVNRSASRSQRLKDAVLTCFYESAPEIQARLAEFTSRDWERILFWLDISGLALYLFDRLVQLEIENSLPESIRLRLENNLIENRERTAALFQEASAISLAMASKRISFALLKGVTLTPESVPDCTLRCQTDLDFLVDLRDASAARSVLTEFGYAPHAFSGRTIEFKAGTHNKPDIRNIYRVHSHRAAELHLLAVPKNDGSLICDRLTRARERCFDGIMIPALSPADSLVQQGLHLFKHLCGEYTRASWVLEFWRHVQFRRGDLDFWNEVKSVAETEPQTYVALGASILLATLAFGGESAPEALIGWTIDRLPFPVRLWIEAYGYRVLTAGSPGSKLYLILRQQLPRGSEMKANLVRLVFPLHMPPPITIGEPGERLVTRLGRYRIEVSHIFARFLFHLVEGMRYAVEASRWQKRLTEAAR
jgi:hypothetical protein